MVLALLDDVVHEDEIESTSRGRRASGAGAKTAGARMTSTVDTLRPSATNALEAWAARVRADREQVERCREVEDPADFYAPVASRFSFDPRRTGDATLEVLRSLARQGERWLDIGSGGGRFALPLALIVDEVVCVEPSDAMLGVLAEGAEVNGIANVRPIRSRWPLPEDQPAEVADVALMAHIGYDIEAIGPFLDAVEEAAQRLCVAVMGEGAMTTVATLFWERIHGEPRVALPALPELLLLLLARGKLPEVRLVERIPPAFESIEDLLFMARRQLWVRPGSEKDHRLERLVRGDAARTDGGNWTLDPRPSRIGVVGWGPG